MNLVVDIGNTRIKCAIYSGDQMCDFQQFDKDQWSEFSKWSASFTIKHCIIGVVGNAESWDFTKLNLTGKLIYLSIELNLPIEILYKTPKTLGLDRIAAVVGAYYTYRNSNVLVIDAGTCITYDFMHKDGRYEGGAISPGKQMRLKAMNVFTARLPLVEDSNVAELIGRSTEESLRNGAQIGMIGEIDYWIGNIEASYGEVKTLVTGGDAVFIKNNLKREVFEHPFLVLFGMSKILEQNVEF